MSGAPFILGLSASHNGATCLLRGDDIVVAIQEERLSRLKRHKLQPAEAFLGLGYCLDAAGIRAADLAAVVLCAQGRLDASPNQVRSNPILAPLATRIPFLTISHHAGHAVSAFATSGFDDAAVLVVDGVGSPLTDLSDDEKQAIVTAPEGHEMMSLYECRGTSLRALEKHMVRRHLDRSRPGLPWFGTLGILFGAMALQMFGNGLEAGKVMGLAPYGKPAFPVSEFFDIVDGRFAFNARVAERFRFAGRWPDHASAYQDLAASGQRALEEGLLHLLRRLRERCDSRNLCYAGGVALNSIANERIVREAGFDRVYVMPAAEDSGPAIGAAYHGLWQLRPRYQPRRLRADALGRAYGVAACRAAVLATPGVIAREPSDVVATAVDLLVDGRILGWFQGRSELGPRALGQRSIVMDPRRADGKDVLNARVKFREPFRPFAPAILLEQARAWFEIGDAVSAESPFMLRVCKFRADKQPLVPAVVHVDGTGRLQTVTAAANGRFHALIAEFHRRTGVPLLLNTSFNVMGEPIVETPEDALWCLLATGIDGVILGDLVVERAPGHDGILDLRPRLRGARRDRAVSEDVHADADFGDAARTAWVEFTVPTPWGETYQRVAPDYAPVLDWVDGRRDGHAIHAAMLAAGGVVNARFVRLALTKLRQARIIDFVS